jgi:DNA ligase-1
VPIFRSLIPARLTDPARLRYPLFLSPKVDGVRACLHPQIGPITRAGNPIQNPHVRRLLADARLHGLDGEIVVGPPNVPEVVHKTITAVVMGRQPVEVAFFAFDDFGEPMLPYRERIRRVEQRVTELGLPWLHVVPQYLVEDAAEMLRVYEQFVAHGFEGGVLRHPEGRYRGGRCTEASRLAIKIKPAEIIAWQRAAVEAQINRKRGSPPRNATR